jgi:hypothetical protein
MKHANQSFEQAFQTGAEGVADGICEDINELLSDPLVQAVMAADHVNVGKFKIVLRKIAASLRGELSSQALTKQSC